MTYTLHTPLDLEALRSAGVDPDSTQPRERAVSCRQCGRVTWNQAAHCDQHYIPPAAVLWTVES